MKKLIICAICAICGFTTANAQAKFGHVNTQEIIGEYKLKPVEAPTGIHLQV